MVTGDAALVRFLSRGMAALGTVQTAAMTTSPM